MSVFEIRPARAPDADAVAAVIADAYAPWRARLPDLPDVTVGIDEAVAAGPAWVAIANGSIVGVLIASPDREILQIVNVAVAPPAAGQGIATALLAEATRHANASGAIQMRLATHGSMKGNIDFYTRLGWEVAEHEGNKVTMTRAP